MKSRSSNKDLKLSIDNNPDKLKIMYCVLVSKSEDELAETRYSWMKVRKELLPLLNDDESCINICKNLWWGIKSVHDRGHKKRKNNPVMFHTINKIEEEEENTCNDILYLHQILHSAIKN